MKSGDLIEVTDGSFALAGLNVTTMGFISANALVGRRWRVLAVDCRLPAENHGGLPEEHNDMVCQEIAAPEHILFVKACFCKLIHRPGRQPAPEPQPSPQEQYVAGQKAWVEKYKVKPGDRVEIVRVPSDEETKGWSYYSWSGKKTDMVGKTFPVIKLDLRCGHGVMLDTGDWDISIFPYQILRKVTTTPQELYIAGQKAWGEENDVKPGDYLEITREPTMAEVAGWSYCWPRAKTDMVGKAFLVKGLAPERGPGVELDTGDSNHYIFPYPVLRKVAEPVVWYARDKEGGLTPNSVLMFTAQPWWDRDAYRNDPDCCGFAFFSLGRFADRFGVTPEPGSVGSMKKSYYEQHKK